MSDNIKQNNNISEEEIKKELKQAKEQEKKNQEIKVKKSKIRMYVVLAFLLVTAIVGYIIFRGNLLETLEIGEKYIGIFWQNVNSIALTFIINFIALFFIIFIVNKKIRKNLKVFFDEDKRNMPKLPNKSIAFILSIIVSSISSRVMLQKYLLFMNSTSFGKTDPVFGYDIGYFMFQKPFIEFMIMYLLFIVVGVAIYSAIYYIATFNIYFEGISRETIKKSKILKQLLNIIMIAAILLAGLVYIHTQNIGFEKFMSLQEDTTYSIYGAGVTDVTIKLWGYRILPIIIIISVFMAIKAFEKGKTRKVVAWIAVVPLYIVVLLLVMLVFQIGFITPNELDKEKQSIEQNIKNTKSAYGIEANEISITNGGATITENDISKMQDTIDNIAIIDKSTVLKDLNAVQTEKGYYTYTTTQIANYRVNGKNKLVYVSPREINSNGTYNNKTYEYTHGYGVVVTSAVSTNTSGNLLKLQKNYTSSKSDIIAITQPRIYFGLQTNNNIVTNSNNRKEFDYPVSTTTTVQNAENIYDGNAGLQLGFLDRFILGVKEGDLKLAFSANVNHDSKILTNRNILKRAKAIMPYLLYDNDPYMVVNEDGRLIWVLDAYTTSDNYPYSQKTMLQLDAINKLEFNYIRNSVKVLIDAYDGTINFYITDRNDPIASAYEKIYPDLFTTEEISTDISSQFVYPKFLYDIQTSMMERYHNIQADVLYRGNDVWDVATHNTSRVLTKTGTDIEAYYTMVKTIDSDTSKLGLVIPFTPYGKQNITSYMVGTYENGTTKLIVYKFSSDSNILGPMQLDTQIEQDEKISKEIDALNVNGTKISKNMIIVPLNNTLLYVEPIYQQYINETDSTPTLKKVVVASGNKLAIGDNLTDALENLVSRYAVDINIENTDSTDDLVKAIIKANGNLKDSTSNGDLEMVGKDVKKLQELIDKLEKLTKEEGKEQSKKKLQNKNLNDISNSANVLNTVVDEIQ